MTTEPAARVSTGIGGLDEVLLGGLLPRRTYDVFAPDETEASLAASVADPIVFIRYLELEGEPLSGLRGILGGTPERAASGPREDGNDDDR